MISRSRLSCSKRRHRIGGAEVRSAIVAACVKGGVAAEKATDSRGTGVQRCSARTGLCFLQ